MIIVVISRSTTKLHRRISNYVHICIIIRNIFLFSLFIYNFWYNYTYGRFKNNLYTLGFILKTTHYYKLLLFAYSLPGKQYKRIYVHGQTDNRIQISNNYHLYINRLWLAHFSYISLSYIWNNIHILIFVYKYILH